MDGFQFIIESPQETQGHKKRPRLVTSCDNCRLKKIKCLQSSPETQCEACKAAKIPCKFRDRERYFAERSRAIAGPSSVPPYHGSSSRATTAVPESSERSNSSSTNEYATPASTAYTPPHGRHTAAADDHSRRYGTSGPGQALGRPHPTLGGYRPTQVFDPMHPQMPQRSWMPHFIQIFISQLGSQCAFMTYDELYEKFRHQTLSPLLSNCIAALGARFSDIPDVVARGPQNVADIFCENAKEMLSAALNQPSLDVLHAVITLAWTEYKTGRLLGFRQYGDLAMRTAMAIGLSEESTRQMSPYDSYQNRLRLTWQSVSQLYASSACEFSGSLRFKPL
ncbi:uncharacterized protein BJ212DRAFT_1448164 [Suillus subaureus]|uniref:Zn(2)-C6 fungal-type domain-containing protein n=1 Tax=Suillus subaureus TaxID=48587 RepID=A0A9P7JB11_9AGAM|nr:uncharacterized protein BJ212DRAFT_1448164 [Suillus subaureus]KAG1812571.1 hypothetical protein BJ212DRAFT_1448164 [Suillus subaureus]